VADMDPALRQLVALRSGRRCEAEVEWSDPKSKRFRTTWLRCGAPATDIHHMLTKARGGRNLDRVHEIYHLIHLCRLCHNQSVGQDAYDGGLLIDGSVSWNRLTNRPEYTGTDPYLKRKYTPIAG